MKRMVRTISALLLAMVMMLNPGVTAFAADSGITFKDFKEDFEITPGSEYTTTDLFGNFKDVMPGDTVTEKVTVKNNYKGCDYVKIYMRAQLHDEKSNPLTYDEEYENIDGKDQTDVSGKRDETVASMEDFLSQLSMTVKQGDKVLFSASPEKLGGLKDNVLLARLAHGASVELTVELSVPIEMGNEYANRVGEVDWVFTAEERNYPDDSDDSKEPEEPEEPEVYPYIPGTAAPTKTGDSANIMLWAGILVAALAAGIYVTGKNKKRRNSK